MLVGVGWIVLGIVLFMQRGLGVDALAVVVGVALVVNGAADALTALRECVEERAAEHLLSRR